MARGVERDWVGSRTMAKCTVLRPHRRRGHVQGAFNANFLTALRTRLGSPALTTRGMKEGEMRQVGRWISEALHHRKEAEVLARIRRQVLELAEAFPLYAERRAKAHAEVRA